MEKYCMKKFKKFTDFNVPISKILYEAKSDISHLILNCYK